jgi:transposase
MSAVTAEDQLFETGSMACGPPPSPNKVPVDKTFPRYDQDQSFLMPPSLRDWLPEDHLAHFVSELVDEVLDLSPFLASYTEARGYPPYDPRLMLKILLYGYTTGVRSSRKIEIRCHDDVAFRFLAANAAPDFRSVARFRKRHLAALEALFTEAEATPKACSTSSTPVTTTAGWTWASMTTPPDPARRLRQRTSDDLRLDARVHGDVRDRPALRTPRHPSDQAWIESLIGHRKAEYPHLLFAQPEWRGWFA